MTLKYQHSRRNWVFGELGFGKRRPCMVLFMYPVVEDGQNALSVEIGIGHVEKIRRNTNGEILNV